MPASSNFREAIRDAQSSALVGPNVVNRALPYVGGGRVLTSVGVLGGLSMIATPIFMPLFWVALIGNFVLFFVAQNVDFDKVTILQKKYYEVIQYESVYDKIIIPVTINGKNYRFLLDTGAPNLISNEVMKELNSVSTKNINVNDANNLNQTMQSVVIPKIEIGNLTFEGQVALVFDLKKWYTY